MVMIEISHLTKKFKNTVVLNDISMTWKMQRYMDLLEEMVLVKQC